MSQTREHQRVIVSDREESRNRCNLCACRRPTGTMATFGVEHRQLAGILSGSKRFGKRPNLSGQDCLTIRNHKHHVLHTTAEFLSRCSFRKHLLAETTRAGCELHLRRSYSTGRDSQRCCCGVSSTSLEDYELPLIEEKLFKFVVKFFFKFPSNLVQKFFPSMGPANYPASTHQRENLFVRASA